MDVGTLSSLPPSTGFLLLKDPQDVHEAAEPARRVWDPTRTNRPITLKGQSGSVLSVAVGVIGGRDVIISGGADGTVRVWEPSGTVESLLVPVGSPCHSVALRNDGLLVLGAPSGLAALVIGPDPDGLFDRGESTPLPFPDQRHRTSLWRRLLRAARDSKEGNPARLVC